MALDDVILFLKSSENQAAIYDGTNTTIKRRETVRKYLEEQIPNCRVIWIESICNDDTVVETNIKLTKLSSPDYKGIEADKATDDFRARIEKYRKAYQTITVDDDGENCPFIKLIDTGKKVVMNNISGYLASKVVSFLMNLHIIPRPIYLTRHGESLYNVEDRVGGDSDLSAKGKKYASHLKGFFQQQKELEKFTECKIFTSTLKRAMTTANEIDIGVKPYYLKILDEINTGLCDGMTYDDMKEIYPFEYQERSLDKLRYRYPRGESYLDVIQRIEPIIFEIERTRVPVIIVAHNAVLRCIYAYLTKNDIDNIPYLDVPLHNIIKLIPETYQCREVRYTCNIETGEYKGEAFNDPKFIDYDFRRV